MAEKKTDKYANICTVRVDGGAPGNCESVLIPTALNINEKVGWIIHRVKINLSISRAALAAGNVLTFGLASAAPPNVITMGGLRMPYIHTMTKICCASAMAVNLGILYEEPIIQDFTMLPGGGKLIPPVPLYAYFDNVGVSVPGYTEFRIEYTQLPLSTDDYWEMVETYRYLQA